MRERLRGVCAVAASGEDPPDRVRPLCGGTAASGAGSASRRPSTSWASPSSAARPGEGNFQLKRKTRRDRMRAKLQEIKEELRRRMHQPIPEQGKWLGQVVARLLQLPRRADQQSRHWPRSGTTSPTSGGARCGGAARRIGLTWERMTQLADDWLPETAHPSSLAERSLCRHTPEVGAVCGKAARTVLCGGRAGNARPYRVRFPRFSLNFRFAPDRRNQSQHRFKSLRAMYGRRARCKRNLTFSAKRSGAAMYPACFRLEDCLQRDAAAVAAGPDVIR